MRRHFSSSTRTTDNESGKHIIDTKDNETHKDEVTNTESLKRALYYTESMLIDLRYYI